MDLPPGSVVGGHRLLRTLGTGGMGAVYLARHPNLPRDVALKVLHSGLAQTAEQRVRFAREAEVLCRLSHPNVVDVLDRGQDGDRLWMSMQYVPGEDLAARLGRVGAAPPAEALRIVDAVAAALDHAHSHGLLHRDVKPANILLDPRPDGTERVVLTDFGIARVIEGSAPLTHTGQVVASFAYAAPEQLEGGRPDRRTDVYSLAAVLFELLTGRRVHETEETLALLWAVVNQPAPDLRALRPDLPPALGAVVARGLAKDPNRRYQSCGAFAAAARAALAPPPVLPPPSPPLPPPPPPRTRGTSARVWAVTGAALLLVAAVVVLVVVLSRSGDGGDDGGGDDVETFPAAQVATTVEGQIEEDLDVGVAVTCEDDLPVAAGASIRCELVEDATDLRYGLSVTSLGPDSDTYQWQVDDQVLPD